MCFVSSKSKVLFQDWTTVVPNLILDGEKLVIVDRPTYLDGYVSKDDSTSVEASTCISNARAACAGLEHLWLRPNISLKLKSHVYCTVLRSVLLYAEEVGHLKVFDHWCLYVVTLGLDGMIA